MFVIKTIDKSNWNGKNNYEKCREYEIPYLNVCATVDIAKFRHFVKELNKPFSISFMYVVARAANDITEFCLRERDNEIVEHDIINPCFNVVKSNGETSDLTVKYNDNYNRFVENTVAYIEFEKDGQELKNDSFDVDNIIHIKTMPFASFTNVFYPVHLNTHDSSPRITWGRYYHSESSLLLPISVQVYHPLAQEEHIDEFFKRLQQMLDFPETFYVFEPDEDEAKARKYDTKVIRASSLNQRMRSKYPYTT